MIYKLLSATIFAFTLSISLQVSGQTSWVVKADQPKADIQPTMWGIFFEDINFAADGGLYAELIKNRSFEFFVPMMGWQEQKPEGSTGRILILNRGATQPSNPRFARVTLQEEAGTYGLPMKVSGAWGSKKR